MKALIDFDGAGTLVANTKALVSNAILAHNADENAHTDTFVTKVAGKDLSSNDFTNAYKSAIDGMSSIYAKKSDVSSFMRYKGSVENSAALPTDTSVLSIGDVYNVSVGGGVDEDGLAIKSGDNVAWTGTGWDNFGSAVDLGSVLKVYVGNVQPTDTSVIWLDTSAYE